MSDSSPLRRALEVLHGELAQIFGNRLISLVAYGHRLPGTVAHDGDPLDEAGDPTFQHGPGLHTLAVVQSVNASDLAACAALHQAWSKRGLETPLLLAEGELARSLDAFPLEFAEIMAHHLVIAGRDPFAGLHVAATDVRRACEVQARGHLIHLREGYIEAAGQADRLARLVAASAPAFRALLGNVARLQGLTTPTTQALATHAEERLGLPADVVHRVTSIVRPDEIAPSDAVRLFPAYLDAVERLSAFIDRWTL
jgi:hypothetical protein